jgi:hypothetical protein
MPSPLAVWSRGWRGHLFSKRKETWEEVGVQEARDRRKRKGLDRKEVWVPTHSLRAWRMAGMGKRSQSNQGSM